MKIVVIGAGGRLGAALVREYQGKFDVTGFNHEQLDLANQNQTRDNLSPLQFDLLINCAAMTNVDLCEQEIEQAFAINAEGPAACPNLPGQKCEDDPFQYRLRV